MGSLLLHNEKYPLSVVRRQCCRYYIFALYNYEVRTFDDIEQYVEWSNFLSLWC